MRFACWACLLGFVGSFSAGITAAERRLSVVFLGDRGHHRPAELASRLVPYLAGRGIEVTYTEEVAILDPERLRPFDGLLLYANIDELSAERGRALLDYVAAGKGFIPLHCASYCFRNQPEVVQLIGAQFQRHGTGVFRVEPSGAGTEHPVTRGFQGFASWDETYVHTRHHEPGRTVLEYRVDGTEREPWTWVRTHGQGRVFYTAWGHDERTWTHPGFQNLVERGIRWACGADPGLVPDYADRPPLQPRPANLPPLEYVEGKLPFYPPSREWGKLAEPLQRVQQPLSPADSLRRMVTPVGFRVELFAAEPDIGKSLAMNWDERGRLWLCESIDYPNDLQPQGQGHDRIRICTDTDGDGRADRFTIFAENLSVPTAIAFYRGGAIVQDGTQTVYLKDTDGDDRADVREMLITGWALGDTHGGVSNFRYGFDNWYYAMQGYNNSIPVYDRGTKRSQPFRMGFFRFRVQGTGTGDDPVRVTDLEFLRSTNNNTWGLGFSEDGLVFGSTANGNPSEFLSIPNRYYERVRGWSASVLTGIADSNQIQPVMHDVRQVDHHGGFTAAAGHAIYTARSWPKEYWNRTAFVCEPTGHLVATMVLRPDGAGFRSQNTWNIVASDDEWFAPITAEVGPDGQLWINDWYNLIVQHNPTPAGYRTGRGNAYESDMRDKRHARIYRVVATRQTTNATPDLEKYPDLSTPATQIAALRHPNLLWRLHGQRLLVEASRLPPAETEKLQQLARDRQVDELQIGTGAIHALHTLAGRGIELQPATDQGASPSDLTELAAHHASPGVRRAAWQGLARSWNARQPNLSQTGGTGARPWIGSGLRDPHPQVRLAALLSLADAPADPLISAALVEALGQAEYTSDRWLRDGLTAAAAGQATEFLAQLLRSPQTHQLLTRQPRTRELVLQVAEHVGREGNANSIPILLEAIPSSTQPAAVTAVLEGLTRGWPHDGQLTLQPADEERLVAAFQHAAAEAKPSWVVLGTRWGSRRLETHAAEIATFFLATVNNSQAEDRERIAAAEKLIEFRRADPAAAKALLDAISPRTAPPLAAGWLAAIARSQTPEAGTILAERLSDWTPTLRQQALGILLSRGEWTGALLAAAKAGRVRLADLSLDQKQALASHPDRRLAGEARRLLEQGGGLPNPDRQKVVDELLPLTRRTADPVAGKEVFKKQCAKCHTHSGEGTRIGPDLTGMAVHPKHELLIHLIDPSRSVEGNFRVYTVALEDGRVLTGLLASESRTAVEIVDAEAKRHAIQRDEIAELVASPKSLMPEGFEKQVTPDDLANLLEFLTQRGKYLPIPLDKVATVVSTKGMFHSESAAVERLIFPDWSTKVFEGIPFQLVDPQGSRQPNVVLLNGPLGTIPPRMPRAVTLPCNAPAKAIHFLSGVSGWGFPAQPKGSVSLIVRLLYADGTREDHPLVNGEHFADYIRRVDVPGSKFAFPVRGQQVRYLAVFPQRTETITQIELVKGTDNSAPLVVAVTVEGLAK